MAEADNKTDKTLSMTSAFESMAKGFFATFETLMPFQPESKALGGSKTPGKVIGKEASTPLGDMSNFFAGIDKSLIDLVNFTKESLGFEKESLESKKEELELNKQIKDIMASGLKMAEKKRLVKKLKEGDTDKKGDKKGEGGVLDTLTEAFSGMGEALGNMSVGEKMGAALLVGGLLIFNNLQDELAFILTPIVAIMKGLVNFLGVGGTFNLFLATFLAFKFGIAQKIIMMIAQKMGFTTLGNAFKALRFFLGTTLVNGVKSTYKGGLMNAATKMLGFAFKALRLMMTVSLYPAIMTMVTTLATALGPILGPIVIIAAIAAGIAAVLFSIKSGIEAFKTSMDQGDSMLLAIGKGILDFAATLYTLPLTLVKNIVAYIAGLLGFDGIKEKLLAFSFKDMIVNAFTGIMSGTIKLLKAIGKGAMAALAAAFPGGESPTGAFGRVFKEVMGGGEGKMPEENPDKEKKTGFNRMETSEVDIDIDGSEAIAKKEQQKELLASTEDNKSAQVPTLATAKALMTTDLAYSTNTINTETTVMKEKMKEFNKFQLEKMKIEKESKSSSPIMSNIHTAGDVYNQKSETNVSGELSTEHTDPTSRMISNAVMV